MTVYKWSQTEISNATADSTINWQEGMAASGVNNSGRAMMAAIAKWRDDIGGIAATTGGPTAFLFTTSQGLPATPNNGTSITFFMNQANSASATLRVDGGGIFPLMTATTTVAPAGILAPFGVYSATFNTSVNGWILNNVYQSSLTPYIIPVGSIVPYAGTSAPGGGVFELCDGGLRNRAGTYAPLFAVISTIYNTGGEAGTQFRLPDLRGRVPAGKDNMGGTAAGRISAATNDDSSIITGTTLGSTGGQMGHVQSEAEMRLHNHSGSSASDSGHAHAMKTGSFLVGGGSGVTFVNGTGTDPVQNTNSGSANITLTIANQGSSLPMNMLQPTIILNYLIRAI